MINVKQLKEILDRYPDELLIVVPGHEKGADPVREVKTVAVIPQPSNPWWEGKFQIADEDEQDNSNCRQALLLE